MLRYVSPEWCFPVEGRVRASQRDIKAHGGVVLATLLGSHRYVRVP